MTNPYIGREQQIFGVEEHRLVGGRGDGMRVYQVTTGGGLMLTVEADRCLDISRVSYRGVNLGYFSCSGYVAPAYFDKNGMGFLDSFTGGFLTTCGLTHFGSPSVDDGEELGLHGPIGGTPADDTEACVDGDEIVIGGVPLLLVLNVPDAPRRVHPAPTAQDDDNDDLFHPDGWEAERSSGSDPVSPIFGREADPFREPPLVDRPRGQRLQPRPAPRPSRNPGDISPIFDTDPSPAPSDGWASGRRPDRRAFLDDDPDDLFRTDDDSL